MKNMNRGLASKEWMKKELKRIGYKTGDNLTPIEQLQNIKLILESTIQDIKANPNQKHLSNDLTLTEKHLKEIISEISKNQK